MEEIRVWKWLNDEELMMKMRMDDISDNSTLPLWYKIGSKARVERETRHKRNCGVGGVEIVVNWVGLSSTSVAV